MSYFRNKVLIRNGKYSVLFSNKTFSAETKQMLYTKLRDECGVKRVYTRKSSIVCKLD